MRQIVQDIYMLEGLRGAHVFLLVAENGLTVVDSATTGGTDQIEAQLKEGGYALSDVRSIVVTHAHSDHTGALAELARRSGAQVLAHQDEVPYLEGKSSLPYAGLFQRLLFGLGERVMFNFESCQVGRALQDGDIIDALGGLQVVHVPGHTPGNIALFQPERRILVCGDTFFNMGFRGVVVAPRIASTHPDGTRASAQRLADLEPETILFGHGEPILEGAAKVLQEALAG
jgi:glyoxylase-like metal-dependent hydrolase (beta-lactamase superfamily II)